MTDVSARLAGWFLYTSRGLVDQEDTRNNQLKFHFDYAESVLSDILAGRIRIDATMATAVTYPSVENEDEDEEEILYYE